MLERRKKQRFSICEPVVVRLNGDEKDRPEIEALTTNVSESGVLLICNTPIGDGDVIEITITLKQQDSPGIRLYSAGRVVRVEPTSAQNQFAIAVKCEPRLSELSSSM
jgi:hypothetical protein